MDVGLPVEDYRKYFSQMHQRIDVALCAAHVEKIDLTRYYQRESKEWGLQIDLDHIGRNLNLDFCGIVSDEIYCAFDYCLARLEGIFKRGEFYQKMVDRREDIRKRHERSRLLEKAVARLTDSFDEKDIEKIRSLL
ncbi:MAG: hypothetical protein RL557_1024 [archaeon]|jgi:hypothetical protein